MNPQNISHYSIIKKIGAGGMGEVYLAEDTRLHRQVALKFLSVEIDSDKSKISRFKQEARAASALNHPNILTVYDIGETDSAHFIATEFVNGKTLREFQNEAALSWQKTIEIIIQIAKALSAAHQVGVVHRDLKPENIMIRNDGYVKVLDFGLAKLTERKFTDNSLVLTEPGLIMGTPRYMSPEQIRRYEVDERSDIFSLGVVFYEMLSGKSPFEGETVSDVIAAVLQNEPADVSHYAPGIPDQIEIILNKALQKDRNLRYQTMAEMLFDLERFQQNPAAEIKDQQSVTLRMPAASTEMQAPAAATNPQNNIQTPQDWRDLTATKKYQTQNSQTTFPKKWLYAAGATLALVVLLPLGILSVRIFFDPPANNQPVEPSPPAAKMMAINRVTNNGKASEAAISPDGNWIAYALAESGKQSLWIRHLPTSKNMQIISPSDVWYGNLIFSADNNYIYYLKERGEISQSEIFMVPVLGGTPKKMAEKTNNSFSLSPDNKQFVFTRSSPDQEEEYLITVNTDGTGEKTIATMKDTAWRDYPAWSPDGKRIAFVMGDATSKDQSASIGEIELDNLQEKIISTQKWFAIRQLAWISDGSGLLMIAKDQEKSPLQIWHLAYPEGAARRVTNDLNNYDGLSTAADSKQLVTVQAMSASGIWTAEKNDFERSRQISSGSGADGVFGIAWTTNGKIVYTSGGDAKSDIWIMDGDGGSQQQLTLNSGTNVEPSVSPDNRYIVFVSDRSGSFNIWRMDVDGGNPIQLTRETGGRLPQFTPDGKWVIYQSHKVGKEGYTLSKETALWKVPIDGGEPVQITDQPSSQPAVSPDGKLIAFYSMKEISVIPTEGGEQKKVMDVPHFTFSGNMDPLLRQFTMRMPYFRWLSDSTGLIYVNVDKGKRELWKIELSKNSPQKLGEFDGNPIYFDWSTNGQKLAYAKGGGTSDVVTISDW